MNTTKIKNFVGQFFKYGFLLVASFISIFPFYWIVVGTTNKSNEIIGGKMTFGSEFITNLKNAFQNTNLVNGLWNSVKISATSVLLSIALCSIAAYGFQMYKSRGKNLIYRVMLGAMMVPFTVILIPQYTLIVKLGLLNNPWSVILPSLTSIFLVFFFYQSLINFPIETIESARLDGASEGKIFYRIVAPQLKATFAAAFIFTFMNSWNNFMWPLVTLQTTKSQTIQLVISSAASENNFTIDYGLIMIFILISTLPVLILFVSMQKHFVEGMLGSTKG